MKTISLKIPDDVYEKVEKYRKSMDKNRSSYVMEAVVAYTKNLEREELAEQIRREVEADKDLYKEIIEEYDHLSIEGLDKLNDEWS